jgi:hypothetical protein
MMKTSTRWILIAAFAVMGVLGYLVWLTMYHRPMQDARERLSAAEVSVRDLSDKLREGKIVRRELAEQSARTLGKSLDTVSHRYTAGLRAIAERNGLGRIVVTHREPERVMSPLTKMTGVRPEEMRKRLRATPDFLILRGTLNAQGTLEQVTRTLAEVDAQVWCRVDSIALRPLTKEAERFSLDLGVAAPLLPDLLAAENAEPELVKERPESSWAMQAIVARNSFRAEPKVAAAPSPPVVVNPEPAPTPGTPTTQPESPLPPPPPPYADWKLTGLVVGARTGTQAMLSNVRTKETVTVLRGAKVEDATLVDARGETAFFDIGGVRFEVRINQTLADRVPSAPQGSS